MKLSCSQQQPLEIHTAALKLIDQIAHNVYIVGRDDICAVGNFFYFPLICVCHAAQKINQTTGNILIGLLQIEDNRALIFQMVCDLRRILKAVGLYKNNSQLRCGVDTDNFIAAAGETVSEAILS